MNMYEVMTMMLCGALGLMRGLRAWFVEERNIGTLIWEKVLGWTGLTRSNALSSLYIKFSLSTVISDLTGNHNYLGITPRVFIFFS